jgi:superfamily I DNA/RNA helicase
MDYQAFVDGEKTLLIAPAGYGKTHTIVECLKHTSGKQLILTHTHAGVASIKEKLSKENISADKYAVETISSFAQKYVHSFYMGADIPEQDARDKNDPTKDYHSFIIRKAIETFQSSIVKQIILSSYYGLFVDEYQDCTKPQHSMIMELSNVLPTHILGDPLQGIFDFNGEIIDFETDLSSFEKFPELSTPERWYRSNSRSLGDALKDIRQILVSKETVDFSQFTSINLFEVETGGIYIPGNICNVELNKIRDNESVLIISPDSTNKHTRIKFTQYFKDFYLVESIDDKDFYSLAKQLDEIVEDISEKSIRDFSYEIFYKTGLNDWFNNNGFKNKKDAQDKSTISQIREGIATAKKTDIKDILNLIHGLKEVKIIRKGLFQSLIKSLELSCLEDSSVFDAMKKQRNNIRRSGRKIKGKCIGTTLLTKGLEFDTVVILDAHKFKCPKHLYVALTRCCKQLIIFSSSKTLSPYP